MELEREQEQSIADYLAENRGFIEVIPFPCQIEYTNLDPEEEEIGISEKEDLWYESWDKLGQDRSREMSFLDRKTEAIQELSEDCRRNGLDSVEKALAYYKEYASEGDCNYWGNFLIVFINTEDTGHLKIGVRMD